MFLFPFELVNRKYWYHISSYTSKRVSKFRRAKESCSVLFSLRFELSFLQQLEASAEHMTIIRHSLRVQVQLVVVGVASAFLLFCCFVS